MRMDDHFGDTIVTDQTEFDDPDAQANHAAREGTTTYEGGGTATGSGNGAAAPTDSRSPISSAPNTVPLTLQEVRIWLVRLYGEQAGELLAAAEATGFEIKLQPNGWFDGLGSTQPWDVDTWGGWRQIQIDNSLNPLEAANALMQALMDDSVYGDRDLRNWLLSRNPTDFDRIFTYQDQYKAGYRAAAAQAAVYAQIYYEGIGAFSNGADVVISANELLANKNPWAVLGLLPLVPGSAFSGAGRVFIKGTDIWMTSSLAQRLSILSKGQLDTLAARLDGVKSHIQASQIVQRFLREIEDDWCFAPETLVSTLVGKKPIAEIEPGEQVYACDFESGAFVLAKVQRRSDSQFSGQWIKVRIASNEQLELTENHPLWVIQGHELASRPIPIHLDVTADEGRSLVGRWINSQDLQVGDVLIGRDGNLVVSDVSATDVEGRHVCNLSVEGHHTFLVSDAEILAHNESWCKILEGKRGTEKPPVLLKIIGEEGLDISRIHGHHIVMKEGKDVYSKSSRSILKKFKIPLLETKDKLRAAAPTELHNMAIAINGYKGIHSEAYAKAVDDRLKAAVAKGKKRGMSDAEIKLLLQGELTEMRKTLEQGKTFWP
jgi:hypothetical protein